MENIEMKRINYCAGALHPIILAKQKLRYHKGFLLPASPINSLSWDFRKGGSTYYVIQKFSDLRPPPPSEASSCVIFGTKKSNIYIIRNLIQKSSKTPLNSQNFSGGAKTPLPPVIVWSDQKSVGSDFEGIQVIQIYELKSESSLKFCPWRFWK